MPFRLELNHSRRRAFISWSDPVGPDDVVQCLDDLAVAGAWGFATLNDARGIASLPTAPDLRSFLDRIAQLSRTHGRRGPVAFVVSSRDALYGMFRMYSMLAEGPRSVSRTEVFLTMEEAAIWLDAPESVRPA